MWERASRADGGFKIEQPIDNSQDSPNEEVLADDCYVVRDPGSCTQVDRLAVDCTAGVPWRPAPNVLDLGRDRERDMKTWLFAILATVLVASSSAFATVAETVAGKCYSVEIYLNNEPDPLYGTMNFGAGRDFQLDVDGSTLIGRYTLEPLGKFIVYLGGTGPLPDIWGTQESSSYIAGGGYYLEGPEVRFGFAGQAGCER